MVQHTTVTVVHLPARFAGAQAEVYVLEPVSVGFVEAAQLFKHVPPYQQAGACHYLKLS